jgi:hypothetical protein
VNRKKKPPDNNRVITTSSHTQRDVVTYTYHATASNPTENH